MSNRDVRKVIFVEVTDTARPGLARVPFRRIAAGAEKEPLSSETRAGTSEATAGMWEAGYIHSPHSPTC